MIYVVWYPSGGFGHFVNALLTLYGENFIRPNKKSLIFSKTGNSHDLDLLVPKYIHNCWTGAWMEFLDDKNYCVLIDNGINDENDNFRAAFPQAKVIKICYSPYSWPIVARTMIEKTTHSSIEEHLSVIDWGIDAPWARREKYFLFLRDHHLRHAWQESEDQSLDVYDLLDYDGLFSTLNSFVKIENFLELWLEWRKSNARYIDPVERAKSILSSIVCGQSDDLTDITDLWTQAIVYYYIWVWYEIEVPHNDYADWFTNTKEIVTMLKDHGVNIDPN